MFEYSYNYITVLVHINYTTLHDEHTAHGCHQLESTRNQLSSY